MLYHCQPPYESIYVNRLLVLLIAVAVGLSACSGAAPAIVNGTPITESELEGLSTGGAVAAEQIQGDLFDLVSTAVATEAASNEFGIVISDEARATELTDIEAAVAAQGSTIEQILEDRARTDSWVDLIITQTILSRDVSARLVEDAEPISDQDLRDAFDAQRLDLTTVCARHILLETEEDATAALERAEAGEDVGDLAIELSTGPSGPSGGDLGCNAPSGYVLEFANAIMEAELDVPFGPVETEFGWHVILVESRDEPEFDEATEQAIRESLEISQGNQLYTDWIIGILRDADVSIAESYGTWTVPSGEGEAPSITPATP